MSQADTIDRWYAAFKAADAETLSQITTDDVVYWWANSQNDLIPWAGPHEGRAAVVACAASMASRLVTRQIDIREHLASGDKVVVTLVGRWMAPATDLDLMARQTDIFTFHGDRIARVECFTDTVGFALLIGRFRRM